MTPEFYQSVREAYHSVCDLPTQAQNEMLRKLCGDNLELLSEVQSLLGYHDDRADAMADSRLGLGLKLLNASGPEIPEMVGRYRILKRIGEGGMGIVFEAQQEHPSRRVALKLIRIGYASKAVLRRFRHEAEMLGRLRHVGIAHIYDAGVYDTPTGAQIPFLAMELIHGTTLLEHARERQFGTRERLALFAQVCDAVEHAHQKGVIHRDLKPGNILVDAGSQPKVLDFGIARATDSDIRATTVQTSTGQLIGTLPYMSPEQVSGDLTALDFRSDVYSLGVILYELLSGRLPYNMQNRSIADSVCIIRDAEPTRLGAINSSYRGDIETLMGKALEKEKERRYGSAGELAADIRRYLGDLPLVARPTTLTYQLRKFARRNRVLVTAAVLCFLLLLAGTAGTTAGLLSAMKANRRLSDSIVEAQAQRDRALQSEARATTELARSEQVTGFMRSILRSVHPSIAVERDTTLLREILESAVQKLGSGELSDYPSVEAEMRATLADTFMGIGENAAALRAIEPGIQLARTASPEHDHLFLPARISYATTLVVWGRHAEARTEFEECMAVRRSAGLPEDESAAVLYSNFAGLEGTLGNTQAALDLNTRALAIRRATKGDRHPDVAASMGNIAGCLKDLKRYDDSLKMMQEALDVYLAGDPPRLLQISILENNMADLLLIMDRPAEAERRARNALDVGARIYRPEHQQIGMTAHTLGLALRNQNRYDEACEQFARSAKILAAAFNEEHMFVGIARMDRGIALTRATRFEEAQEELLAAQPILSKSGGLAGGSVECQNALMDLYEAWDRAEPGKGYDIHASSLRAQLQKHNPGERAEGME